MFRNVTPEKAIEFTWLSVAVMCCLPLPATATRSQLLRFKILRFLGALCACGLILPLLYAVYMKYDDPVIFTNAAGLAVAVCQVPVHVYLSIIYYDRIQAMIEYMTNYCGKAKSSERQVLQRYVDKYATFYGLCTAWFYVTAAVFDVGALFAAQPFPSNAEYPFAVDYEPLKSLIFLHHVVVSFQCSGAVCMNAVAALMILFAAARFEILMLELRAVQNVETLIRCVKEYHLVRSYAQEVVSVFRHTVIYTTCMATVPLVLSGLSMIGHQPLVIKLQFLFLGGIALLEVYLCAWPADDLFTVSESVVRSVYESKWYEQNVGMQKTVLLALLPQRPITISLACVIPALSLEFYCSYVANAFSLFTALRLVVNDET
ncbi:uncharacterized protein LOC122396967 [Colletes gigas]|uniref:uncharacterized protein LOC122396967 n=1 Tax=Colletes gigas TaxID=935657 RepID=UPI001C9B63C3|nr:uncharacterized protein LOC122396967 [Colletes gigas]